VFLDVDAEPEVESEEPCEALVPVAVPEAPSRRAEPLPPSRDVSDELETQNVADLPRWMPNLRGVMQRARAIRDAATGPLPDATHDFPVAAAWPAAAEEAAPASPARPKTSPRITEENEEEAPVRRSVERATPLQRALGSQVEGREEREPPLRAGRGAARDRPGGGVRAALHRAAERACRG
jgi:hypothetical protein